MIYFLSDAHIGSLLTGDSKAHQNKIASFLDSLKADATAIYLMGDIFDFWFEYHRTIPQGYDRILGNLAELCDSGIEVHLFVGNHDMWTFGYMENSIGIKVHFREEAITLCGKRCFLAHGDTLCTNNKRFMFLLKMFKSPVNQWLFRNLLPSNIGLWLAFNWAKHSREKALANPQPYRGENKEQLVLWAKQHEQSEHFDYYIFGHRHIELDLLLSTGARVIILGDCFSLFTYGKLDSDGNFTLDNF